MRIQVIRRIFFFKIELGNLLNNKLDLIFNKKIIIFRYVYEIHIIISHK